MPHGQSNISINETLKKVLNKNHDTSKKTFGMFSEIKNRNRKKLIKFKNKIHIF